MSDDPFDTLLDAYFSKKGTWTLFEAICLFEKIDPESRNEPITDIDPAEGDDSTTDYTVRPCKVAITSIKEAALGRECGSDGIPNLVGSRDWPDKIGAAQYSVDPRKFVEWATKKWPSHAAHLRAAEDRYQARKQYVGMTPAEKEACALQEFLRMVARGEFDPNDHVGKVSGAAETLAKRLTRYGYRPYKPGTLRRMIPNFIEDELARKFQDSD